MVWSAWTRLAPVEKVRSCWAALRRMAQFMPSLQTPPETLAEPGLTDMPKVEWPEVKISEPAVVTTMEGSRRRKGRGDRRCGRPQPVSAAPTEGSVCQMRC